MLLAEYLSMVRPLEVFFSEKYGCAGISDLNEFLWAEYRKGVWDGDFLSVQLQISMSSHGMHGLEFQEYRQVATAFMEKHLKQREDESDSWLDSQAGHSSHKREMEYARSTEDYRQVSREAMYKFFLVSKEWHKLLLTEGSESGMGMEMELVRALWRWI